MVHLFGSGNRKKEKDLDPCRRRIKTHRYGDTHTNTPILWHTHQHTPTHCGSYPDYCVDWSGTSENSFSPILFTVQNKAAVWEQHRQCRKKRKVKWEDVVLVQSKVQTKWNTVFTSLYDIKGVHVMFLGEVFVQTWWVRGSTCHQGISSSNKRIWLTRAEDFPSGQDQWKQLWRVSSSGQGETEAGPRRCCCVHLHKHQTCFRYMKSDGSKQSERWSGGGQLRL